MLEQLHGAIVQTPRPLQLRTVLFPRNRPRFGSTGILPGDRQMGKLETEIMQGYLFICNFWYLRSIVTLWESAVGRFCRFEAIFKLSFSLQCVC